jgi:hypothetical protein
VTTSSKGGYAPLPTTGGFDWDDDESEDEDEDDKDKDKKKRESVSSNPAAEIKSKWKLISE